MANPNSTISTAEIGQYYPSLQPLLTEIQEMIPPGRSSSDQQTNAMKEVVNKYTAENSEFKHKLSASLNDQVNKYVDLSHRLNDYNEIYNTNSYIHQELGREDEGMDSTTKQLKNSIFISKQKSQLYEYQKNKLIFYKGLFLISCFIIIDLLTFTGVHLSGKISSKILYIIAGISAVVYLCGVFFLVYSNSYRSHTDWNKFYWSSLTSNQSQSSCPGSSGAVPSTLPTIPAGFCVLRYTLSDQSGVVTDLLVKGKSYFPFGIMNVVMNPNNPRELQSLADKQNNPIAFAVVDMGSMASSEAMGTIATYGLTPCTSPDYNNPTNGCLV